MALARVASALQRLTRAARGADPALYLIVTTAAVVFAGALFISGMMRATAGEWSAPLDATFVHFDFARAAARGFPLQWSEGNGYSTGDGSVAYPIVLALGWRTAWPGVALMKWALFVAAVSSVGYLGALRRVFDPVGRWAKYLCPVVVLTNGDVDAALASGMESAFLLGLLGLSLRAVLYVEEGALAAASTRAAQPSGQPWMGLRALGAGVACMLLVLTRPEAISWVMCLGVYATARTRWLGRATALGTGGIVALPGTLALGVVSLVGFDRTGEWLPAGRVARLLSFDPGLDGAAKLRVWASNVRELSEHVVSVAFAPSWLGFVPLAFALVPLADRRVRRFAILLWAMALTWLPIAALAERPTTDHLLAPLLALVLTLGALGLTVACGAFGETLARRAIWGVRTSVAALVALAFFGGHAPRFREVERAFARDALALRDQPLRVGALLASADPMPRRVLVSEPGAITYAADRPGLDISGRGAFGDLPFARARRAGLGAVIELIERMPDADRPDVLALSPSDAPELLLLFGDYLNEVRAAHPGERGTVVYRADWRALDRFNGPRSLVAGESVVAQVDVADPWSEREESYGATGPARVSFHVLDDSDRTDLFDAGRMIAPGEDESIEIRLPIGGGRLVARTAALTPATVRVTVDGRAVGALDVVPSNAWAEPSVELPSGLRRGRITLAPVDGAWVDYHLWVVATR